MQSQEHEKAFEKSLNYLAQRHGIRQVFEAVIDLTLFNLILTDEAGLRKNPLQDYTEDERQKLVKCLEALGEIMENGGQGMYDALGDLFMEYLSFGKNGQFFTPQPICDAMCLMTLGNPEDGKTVCDPTCGSGRMLLGAAKINRKMIFFGSDVDLLCVKMTVLNLALNNLVGEIVWGNPLTLEVWASFHIRREFLTGFPIIFIQKESNQFGKLQSSLKTAKNDQKTEIENKPVQLTLFD